MGEVTWEAYVAEGDDAGGGGGQDVAGAERRRASQSHHRLRHSRNRDGGCTGAEEEDDEWRWRTPRGKKLDGPGAHGGALRSIVATCARSARLPRRTPARLGAFRKSAWLGFFV